MANWTNNYAAGSGASNWRVAGNATGSTGLSDTAVFTSSTSGGVQKGTQTLNFLATGTNSGATDLLMNFSGRIAGNLSFSFDKVVNTANASPRTSDLKIQYSTNNGTSFTDLSPYTIPRISNNSTAESGSRDVALPSALNGQSQVVIRFFFWNNGQTGGSGNRPKWAIDNVAVTSTSAAPSSQATSFGSSGITSSNATISWVRGNGDAGVLVVARSGGAVNADPTDNTNYTASATFGSGTQIGTGNWVVYKGTGTSVNVTGLSPSTAYHFAIYEYNSTGTTHNMTELTGSITTSAGLSAPTLSSPTVTSITTTTATLGATVASDGGASLSARGTVWGTTASPTGNSLAEGGTSVATFTHSRTGLTANTAYFYRGYATNSQGTAYSADGTFTTLPLPPTVGTGSAAGENGFTANWSHPTMGSAAYTYTVEVDDDINFGSINATVSSISSSSTSQAINGLSPSTTYYYRIKSVNAQGDSTWSATSAGISTTAAASLIAGWDFQTTATGGTAVVAATSTPTLFVANFGSGTLFLNGTNGSSSWSQASELSGFSGTNNNTDGTSFSTTTTSPAALALLGGSGTTNSANGKSIVFRFSMRTYESLSVSYSTQKTSTGFDSHLWEYSSDGSSWTTAETIGSIPSSFGAKTLASISALNGAQDAYLRVTFSGSTGSNQNNRLDNIQIKGVPRPTIQTSGTPAALTTTYGTASSNTTFTVNGTFMTAGILVTPPSGFEVSTDGTSYSSTVTVGSSGSIANTTVYLRLAATASAGAKSGNIVLSSSGATNVNVATTASTVNQKAVTITGLSASNKTFDANTTVSVTGTPTYSGLENGETTAVTGSVSWAFPDANVGNNKSLTRTGSYNAPSANYSLTQPTLTANITARALTITANGTSKVFGNTLTGGAGSTAFTSSGLQGTDSLASVTIAYGSGAASGDAAGAYPGSITPSAAVFGSGSASNYSISYVAGTLTVTQATQTISFSALSAVTYGDAAFGLSATASSGLSVSYTSSNTSVATISGSTVTILAAGSTTITASQAGNANYSAAANVNQTLTVNTKSLTGSFTANNKTYDGTTSATVATRAVTGTVGADVVNHTGGTATFANAAVGNGKTVTLAGATLTGADAANYSLSSVSTTTANITQATPTVSVAPTASAITYGQALSASTITPGTSSVAGTYAFASPATTPAVGTASQSITFTPTDSGNYTTASTSANVTVNQAALTITGISIANKTYDGNTTATITGTAAYSGLVLGQSLSVTGTGSATFGNATVGSNKPVTVTGYTAPNGNYSITQPTGLTGNITAASVTVTAGNQTKAFGANDPALTYTSSPSSLIAGNSFTGALSRAAGEGVGTYAISQGTLSAGSNYTISFVGANLTITQATPSITTAPTASTITSGQALSNSTLSGGTASIAGSFAFTTPATVPSPGIASQGVTFTPTDTGNYTTQTTSVNVGVLCTAPVLTRGSAPTGTGFTVNWGAVTGAGNYTVIHSASKNMSDATSADTDSTSLALTVPSGIRYVQVRANNAAGASANSTMQVNQLRSIAAGATAFLSVPGVVNGGNATIAEIFGSSNEAGLAANGTPSNSTNIIRLNADGDTLAGIIFRTGNWTRGDTVVNTEIIPAGKAFMLKNNSSEVDHILLVASAAEGPRSAVSISAPSGKHSLVTPARTKATTLTTLGFTDGGNNTATGIKRATLARDADVIIIQNNSGRFIPYHFDGTNWRNNRTIVDPSTISVPSGGAFYIRKASGSNFSEWTPPAED
ncbi:MAG: fibronectin type III domain-containing protein [Verrucomicrobia bacterium]|nr:fibronectin type III domain-containing protein [Verrucomicrobiota bacterium]